MAVDALLTDMHPAGGRSNAIAAALLAHYDRHARTLPWRAPPGANATDPYRVWLSEIMLQQTTVAAVIPYFISFTTRWPTVADLAAADEGAVMAAWAGLGYYARARNLIACARAVVRDHGGRFPSDEAALRTLPGIGDYTAAAIAAIAFGAHAVAVDANVERVVARLFAIADPLPAGRKAIRAAAATIAPQARCGDFTQAMMDLGATICTARSPRCLLCPLSAGCAAQLAGTPEAFPVKLAKKPRPERHGCAWWIERDGPEGPELWLARRPAKGMLGGMRALPGSDWTDAPSRHLPFAGDWRWADTAVTHVFTHFALSLEVAAIRVRADAHELPGIGGGWWPVASLDEAGLPTLYVKAARAVADLPKE